MAGAVLAYGLHYRYAEFSHHRVRVVHRYLRDQPDEKERRSKATRTFAIREIAH
jgi:hypothetical protein